MVKRSHQWYVTIAIRLCSQQRIHMSSITGADFPFQSPSVPSSGIHALYKRLAPDLLTACYLSYPHEQVPFIGDLVTPIEQPMLKN